MKNIIHKKLEFVMIVFTIGPYSSASTWVFNVTRSIVATLNGDSASCYCEGVEHFLKICANNFENLVIKSHSLDKGMVDFIRTINAKVIYSTRDPRDSYVSLSERFGYEAAELLDQIARSFTVGAIVRAELDHFPLVYEDNFMDRVEIVDQIASYLGVKLNAETSRDISEKHRKGRVQSYVQQLAAEGRDPQWFDPATHWHPGHVGDGSVGKWESYLSSTRAAALCDALSPCHDGHYQAGDALVWRPEFFRFMDGHTPASEKVTLPLGPAGECLVFGPYLYLPEGRWRAEFLLSCAEPGLLASLRIEISDSGDALDLLALKKVQIGQSDETKFDLIFDHTNHLRKIEARIHVAPGGTAASVIFSGVRFIWMAKTPPDPAGAVAIEPTGGDQKAF